MGSGVKCQRPTAGIERRETQLVVECIFAFLVCLQFEALLTVVSG